MTVPQPLSPAAVLQQVAAALPEDCREHVIIIGSLAAGYYFFARDGARAVRTKDVDCMFSPHAKAVAAAAAVTQRLLASAWTPRDDATWGKPGTADQLPEDLPLVRLRPPVTAADAGTAWFLELLSAPPAASGPVVGKQYERVVTDQGHYAICSFGYLALAEWNPVQTEAGIRIARPETMALANLLHHPVIGPELVSGTNWRRSNKDLGRVVTLAFLTRLLRPGAEWDAWAPTMAQALRETFPAQAAALARRARQGLDALMASPGDLAQALVISNRGLLAGFEVDEVAFRATARTLQVEVLDEVVRLVG
jgi:hypothetical protein